MSEADFSTLFGIAELTLLLSADLKYLSALFSKLPTMESAIQMIWSLARQQAASADHASVLGVLYRVVCYIVAPPGPILNCCDSEVCDSASEFAIPFARRHKKGQQNHYCPFRVKNTQSTGFLFFLI